jgi:hypothetical protein
MGLIETRCPCEINYTMVLLGSSIPGLTLASCNYLAILMLLITFTTPGVDAASDSAISR